MKKITLTGTHADRSSDDFKSVILLEPYERVVFETTLPVDYAKVRILMHFDIVHILNSQDDQGPCSFGLESSASATLSAPTNQTAFLFGLCNTGADEDIYTTEGSIFIGLRQIEPIKMTTPGGGGNIYGLAAIPGTKSTESVNSYILKRKSGVTSTSYAKIDGFDNTNSRSLVLNSCARMSSRGLDKINVDTTSVPLTSTTKLFDYADSSSEAPFITDGQGYYNFIGAGAIMVHEISVLEVGTLSQRINPPAQRNWCSSLNVGIWGGASDIGAMSFITAYPYANVIFNAGIYSTSPTAYSLTKNTLAGILINPDDSAAWCNVAMIRDIGDRVNVPLKSPTSTSGNSLYLTDGDPATGAGSTQAEPLPTKITILNPFPSHRMRLFSIMYMQVE